MSSRSSNASATCLTTACARSDGPRTAPRPRSRPRAPLPTPPSDTCPTPFRPSSNPRPRRRRRTRQRSRPRGANTRVWVVGTRRRRGAAGGGGATPAGGPSRGPGSILGRADGLGAVGPAPRGNAPGPGPGTGPGPASEPAPVPPLPRAPRAMSHSSIFLNPPPRARSSAVYPSADWRLRKLRSGGWTEYTAHRTTSLAERSAPREHAAWRRVLPSASTARGITPRCRACSCGGGDERRRGAEKV